MSINEALDEAERVVDPARGARLVWKLATLVLSITVCVTIVRVIVHFVARSEDMTVTVTTDRVWFARKHEEVRALDAEIAAAREALDRKKQEASERWISRSDDRAEFDRLNGVLLDLQHRRASLVRDYNTARQSCPDLNVAPIDSD